MPTSDDLDKDDGLDKDLASWGSQTIAFAISLRAEDDGEPLDSAAQVTHAGEATTKVAVELWQVAAKKSTKHAEFMTHFIRSVFEWVEDYRTGRSKPGKNLHQD